MLVIYAYTYTLPYLYIVRFGIVVSIATCGTLLIFAFTQTISANVKGCKDVTKDPNAEREGCALSQYL